MRQREIDKLNRETEKRWRRMFDQMPAKVGTVPMLIWIDHPTAQKFMNKTLEPGERVVFYEDENGHRMTGNVIKLDPILFLERM